MVSYKHPGLFFFSLSYHGTESFCHADASLCSFVLNDKVGNCLKLRCLRLMGSIERKTIKITHPLKTSICILFYFFWFKQLFTGSKSIVVNLKSVLIYCSCWFDTSLHKITLACYSNAWTCSHSLPPPPLPWQWTCSAHPPLWQTEGTSQKNIKYWCVKPECQQVKGQHYSSRAITEEWVSTWRPSA